MSNTTLTATQEPKAGAAGAPLNVTSLLASIGSATGVTFQNSGRERLFVQQGTATSTMVVAIGATIEGQAVGSITYAGVASDLMSLGPFDSDFDDANGNVTVTFGTPANITGVALVAMVGSD